MTVDWQSFALLVGIMASIGADDSGPGVLLALLIMFTVGATWVINGLWVIEP